MSLPTFPLSTLAAQITATGISAPSYSDILNSLIASFQSIYGSDVVLTPDTQDGQWLAVIAAAINDTNQVHILVYSGFAPGQSQGANLSALVKINGLQRQQASNSTAVVTVVGVAGTTINSGIVQDTNGNLWNLPAVVTIPGGGSVSVTVTAQVQGAINVAASTITTIFTPTQGWQTVTNPAPSVPGAPVETDAQLRGRQVISTGLPAQTPLSAIAAAVANIIGVVRSFVYENPTGSTDSNGIPAHSICAVVQGGVAQTIAQVIEQKKSPGTGTFGNTTITVTDPGGLPVAIKYSPLTLDQIYVTITIKRNSTFSEATVPLIQAALVTFLSTLPIGGKVYFNQIMGIGGLINTGAVEYTFQVTALATGTAPGPSGTTDIAVAFDHAATSATANIIVNET